MKMKTINLNTRSSTTYKFNWRVRQSFYISDLGIHRYVAAMLLILVSNHAFAQYNAANISEDLKKGAYAVVREDITNVEVFSNKSSKVTTRFVATILDERGEDYAIHRSSFDQSFYGFPSIKGALYDQNGKLIRKIKKKDIQNVSAISSFSVYEDNRIAAVDLRHNQYPYTVEFETTQNLNAFAIVPGIVPALSRAHTSVEQFSYTVKMPDGLKLLHKTQNLAPPTINGNSYTWKAKNLKPITREPRSPSLFKSLPLVMSRPESFEVDGYQGSFKSWKALGQFFYDINEGRDELPTEMVSKVQSLTKGMDDPQEIIEVLYRYMQENTRYVSVQLGLGGFQTFDANYVYENGFGDCKALTNYMKSMLKEVDIPAYTAAIYADDDPRELVKDFPSFQFNHVILCVPFENDTTWLECTSNVNPSGYLGEFTEDRYALLQTERGGFLVRTPNSPAESNEQIRIADVKLDEMGNAEANASITYTGYQQDGVRSLMRDYTADQRKKWLRSRINLGSFEINEYDIKVLETAFRPTTQVSVDINARKWASPSGDRLFLSLYALGGSPSVPKAMSKRTQPIKLPYAYLDTDTITYHIPEGYHIESKPEFPIKVIQDFGAYEINMIQEDQQKIIYTRRIRMEKTILPAERYKEYRDFYRQVNRNDRLQIVLAGKS